MYHNILREHGDADNIVNRFRRLLMTHYLGEWSVGLYIQDDSLFYPVAVIIYI